jgi:dihydrofolate reductase
MPISLIVARGKNGVIGSDGKLPWRLKDDLAFFKSETIGKPVLMGRKTWDSIGRILPGRPNLVVTRTASFRATKAWVFGSIESALQTGLAMAQLMPTAHGEVCVIGGGEIYRQTLAYSDRLMVTDVDASPAGDALFPKLDKEEWKEVKSQTFEAGDGNDHAFTITTYSRLSK